MKHTIAIGRRATRRFVYILNQTDYLRRFTNTKLPLHFQWILQRFLVNHVQPFWGWIWLEIWILATISYYKIDFSEPFWAFFDKKWTEDRLAICLRTFFFKSIAPATMQFGHFVQRVVINDRLLAN